MRAVTHLVRIGAALVAVALLGSGCLGPGKWFPDSHPDAPGVLLMSRLSSEGREPDPLIPEIPARKKARMCCAFGTDMSVKLGALRIPWLAVGSVLDVGDLGPHRYDGATAAIDDRRPKAFPRGEANGLIYTCNAGFIDTAHVRETVDWSAYFIAQLDRHLEHGATIPLSPEGAERRLVIHPAPPELIERYGRYELIVALAQWLAYEASVWHEIAQWYGWSLVTLYPETLSGFSPEDPISNAIGSKLLSGADVEQVLGSELTYNRNVDQLIQKALAELNPVPADVAVEVVRALDDAWWDSQASLPENRLVRRRYLDTDTELEAWLVPDHAVSPALGEKLAAHCGEHPEPAVIRIPDSLGGVPFGELATLEIRPIGHTAEQPIMRELGSPITQEDFPRLMEQVRADTLASLGPRADRPE
jgi:hypothetical protein